MRHHTLFLSVVCIMWFGFVPPSNADEIDNLLKKIHAVDKYGKGNPIAAKAWQELSQKDSDVLPRILDALNGAEPIPANWLRFAFDSIAERTLKTSKSLPASELERFVLNTKNNGTARRLAYEWLAKADNTAYDRLIPKMLDDPSQELRRDAVQIAIDKAEKFFEKKNNDAAKVAFQKAFKHVRDRDQLLLVAARLKTLGVKIDTTKHFGFITDWYVVGPFDSKDGVGFRKQYPPEDKVLLSKKYHGKENKVIQWKPHHTKLNLGMVDFNKAIGDLHGVCAYAYTVVVSKKKQPVEIRAGSNNALLIFLNGKKIYSREEYHHGMRIDQHVAKCVLQKGRNALLVKVCQNEQEKDAWAQRWSFQLRVCDAIGGRVPLEIQLPQLQTSGGSEQ